MLQRNFSSRVRRAENILSFPRPSEPNQGAAALDLVYQAADIFQSIEERARETEARAQSLCKSALERLQAAESRADAAEQAQRRIILEAEHRLQDASKALELAQSRISAQGEELVAVEMRAEAAEAEARQARQALLLVEEAIRKRLLGESLGLSEGRAAVA